MRFFNFGALRERLLLLMLLALLPLGLIALGQTFRVVEESQDLARTQLLDVTSAAASEQSNKIERALGAGAGLGTVVLGSNLTQCRVAMKTFLEDNPIYAFVGFIPADGVMRCNGNDVDLVDFSDYPNFDKAIERADTYIEISDAGALSGAAVMVVNVPVFRAEQFQGFLSLSLPQETLRTSAQQGPSGEMAIITAIVSSGASMRLSGPEGESESGLPEGMPLEALNARSETAFSAQNASGVSRIYSVTGDLDNGYLIVGSWPKAGFLESGVWGVAAMPLLFAILMWVASMMVGYFGLNRLVLRHLKQLRSAMRQFALGERSSEGLLLDGAPDEFKDAERAFNRMALLVTDAEARQLTDLHDKEVLLREVHHRVKNNLQMIASIMNLQSRSARTEETRVVLGGLQRRVRGLATLHRSLYAEPETAQIDAQDLLEAVVSEATAVLPAGELKIEKKLISAMLYPDQAVPLSMWASEALTNAVKYVGSAPNEAPFIKIIAEEAEAGELLLTISNSVGAQLQSGRTAQLESTGLGTKLMTAFCRQLEGEATQEEGETVFTMQLRFEVQGFSDEIDDQ